MFSPIQDLRYAIRTLWRVRGFATVAILSLALGIGAATAVFSLVDGVLLTPLAYRDPAKLVLIREAIPSIAHLYPTFPANFQHFKFWKDHADSFDSMAAIYTRPSILTGAGEPQQLAGVAVSANLFSMLGAEPRLGRGFLPEEEQGARNNVVVISDALWRSRFNAAPDLVGRTIMLDGLPNTVVGILPADFHFAKGNEFGDLTGLPNRTDVFRPLTGEDHGWQGDYDYAVLARLKPGVSAPQALAALNALEARIAADHDVDRGLHVTVTPLQGMMTSSVWLSLWVLLGAVLVLLLIVCVNLASLLLARSSGRAREFSIRTALGASRGRLLAQMLIETLLLSVTGGLLGIAAAALSIRAFARFSPVRIPRLDEVHVDVPILLFALLVSGCCGLFFGLLPAFRMSRMDPQAALRSGGRSFTESGRVLRAREWMIGLEVAMSAILLILAGLLTSSLNNLMRVDKGFRAERAIAVTLDLPVVQYKSPADVTRVFENALDRVQSIPGVTAAAYGSKLPLAGESSVNGIHLAGADAGALDPATNNMLLVNVRFVSPTYFSTLGIPLIKGRLIEAADRDRSVAVVSATVAAKVWPGQNPLGKRFSSGSGVGEVEVVGVSGDVHASNLEGDPTPMIYVPYWKLKYGSGGSLAIRTAMEPAALMSAVRARIWSLDPSIPIPPMQTMDEIVSKTTSQRRFQMTLAGAFAIAALLLASIGIYGVISYNVAQRRTEIGVRIALGAQHSQVMRMILAKGLRPVILGLAGGIAVALEGGRFVSSLLFGVRATDPVTVGAVAFVLIASAIAACIVPSRAATRVDPGTALRYE